MNQCDENGYLKVGLSADGQEFRTGVKLRRSMTLPIKGLHANDKALDFTIRISLLPARNLTPQICLLSPLRQPVIQLGSGVGLSSEITRQRSFRLVFHRAGMRPKGDVSAISRRCAFVQRWRRGMMSANARAATMTTLSHLRKSRMSWS